VISEIDFCILPGCLTACITRHRRRVAVPTFYRNKEAPPLAEVHAGVGPDATSAYRHPSVQNSTKFDVIQLRQISKTWVMPWAQRRSCWPYQSTQRESGRSFRWWFFVGIQNEFSSRESSTNDTNA